MAAFIIVNIQLGLEHKGPLLPQLRGRRTDPLLGMRIGNETRPTPRTRKKTGNHSCKMNIILPLGSLPKDTTSSLLEPLLP